jgi:mono/diheme cytochrome c family protein
MLKRSMIGILFGALAIVAWNLSAQAAADGKALYDKHCKTCHGIDGTGMKDGKPLPIAKAMKLNDEEAKKLNLVASKKTEAEIEKDTLEGVGKMKPMKGKMTDEEAKAIATYSKGLQK